MRYTKEIHKPLSKYRMPVANVYNASDNDNQHLSSAGATGILCIYYMFCRQTYPLRVSVFSRLDDSVMVVEKINHLHADTLLPLVHDIAQRTDGVLGPSGPL